MLSVQRTSSTAQDSGKSAPGLPELQRTVNGLRVRLNRLERELADRPTVCLSVITDLGDEGYRLLAGITLVLEEYRDEVVARWPEVELYASGTTESEAVAGIKRQIIELFEELRTMDSRTLGKLPLSWKRILRRNVKRNG